ncbi:MAG: C_GCAxxG_C_C family protein [Paludibacteraceae bacterium]|nr:C_GCAxxG_C_C family protein [Paludibacteraceae bacterium]
MEKKETWSVKAEEAADLFVEGYNCGQAVLLAFADEVGLEREVAARMGTAFGGGVGRQREVCGAVLSLAAVVGMKTGGIEASDKEAANRTAQEVQRLCSQFKERYGSIVCGEILGLKGFKKAHGNASQIPIEEKYAGRPCAMKCKWAAELLDCFLHRTQRVSVQND